MIITLSHHLPKPLINIHHIAIEVEQVVVSYLTRLYRAIESLKAIQSLLHHHSLTKIFIKSLVHHIAALVENAVGVIKVVLADV